MHDVAKSISSVPSAIECKTATSLAVVGIAIGLLVAILVFAFGIKALQIGKMMSTPHGDAADDGSRAQR